MLDIVKKVWTTAVVICCITGMCYWTPRVIEWCVMFTAMLRSSPSLTPAMEMLPHDE